MPRELPEELLSLILAYTGDIRDPFEIPRFPGRLNGVEQSGPALSRVPHTREMFFPARPASALDSFLTMNFTTSRTLLQASTASQAFRRMALPSLYCDMTMQLTLPTHTQIAHMVEPDCALVPYFPLVKALFVQDIVRRCELGWFLYTQIISRFPNLVVLNVDSENNIIDSGIIFLRALLQRRFPCNAVFPRLTLDSSKFSLQERTPDSTSTEDLSHISILKFKICNDRDFPYLENWLLTGLRVKTLRVKPTATSMPSRWTTLTFHGLTALELTGSVECLNGRSNFLDFVSRHPLLDSIVTFTRGTESLDFPLTSQFYQEQRSTIFRSANVLFQRDLNSELLFLVKRVEVIPDLPNFSSAEALMHKVHDCFPCVQNLLVDLRDVHHEVSNFTKEFSGRLFSPLSHLKFLQLYWLPVPKDLPPTFGRKRAQFPPWFCGCGTHIPTAIEWREQHRPALYDYSVHIAENIFSQNLSMTEIEIRWAFECDHIDVFWSTFHIIVERDKRTGSVTKVTHVIPDDVKRWPSFNGIGGEPDLSNQL